MSSNNLAEESFPGVPTVYPEVHDVFVRITECDDEDFLQSKGLPEVTILTGLDFWRAEQLSEDGPNSSRKMINYPLISGGKFNADRFSHKMAKLVHVLA